MSPPEVLLAARDALLKATEVYACGLTARGLPIPYRVRDDLRLQQLFRQPAAGKYRRSAKRASVKG